MAMKKEFKAESRKLMDMMINSIYTHKEIFLRELISNASDAIDKLYYKSLTEEMDDVQKEDLKINLEINKEERSITISDNGIGMNESELEENLGTIARSGSLDFKNEMEEKEDVDIIGQFGVGFYSAFMVAKKVEVTSKKYGETQAYRWGSEDVDGYEIEPCEKDSYGTEIKLYLREDSEEENYSDYLETYTIERLVKKYSDYVRYPIILPVETSHKKEDSDEYETVIEMRTLNSMIPLWKKNKKEITQEEYDDFYMSKFNDYTKPLSTIHTSVEGNVSYDALLYIPSRLPMNYYSNEYEKGLQLYSRGIFIMDKASELIPEHFRFVRGLVDSQDLSLNISREMLQHDRQLRVIASRIEKKIKSELLNMLRNDREKYEEFWKTFGVQIKYGVYSDFGAHKEMLQDLLMFYSSREMKLVTLDEYVAHMDENQKHIYFVSGSDIEKIDRLPQVERVKDKGYEILYLVDEVDEFALQILNTYKEKTFKNISQGDLDLDSEEEKKAMEEKNESNKDLLTAIKDALENEVAEVKISSRLKSHPVCLSAGEGMSFEMEKVLNNMPDSPVNGMKATRILEINPEHPIFNALVNVFEKDKDMVKEYASLLYDQALLMEGFEIEDPIAFSNKICDLMVKASRK